MDRINFDDMHDSMSRDIATLQRLLEWAVMEMEDLDAQASAAELRQCIETFRREVDLN